ASEERDVTMDKLTPIQLKAIYKKRTGLFVALDSVYTDPLGHSIEKDTCAYFNTSRDPVLLSCPRRDLGFAPPWWKGTRKYLGWAPKSPQGD
ncbi:MAG TPA: hypothetical protein VMR79_06160, partial [Verrucomicrobiae bacterium]|nr:hypothetical protein [Verrucomicrobiae bacterium]